MLDLIENNLSQIKQKYKSISSSLGKNNIMDRLTQLDSLLAKSEIYTDIEKSKPLLKEQSVLNEKLNKIIKAEQSISDIEIAIEFYKLGEKSFENQFNELLKTSQNLVDELYLEKLYSGEYDEQDVLLEIHAGAGGEEAQDWADMLGRMYTKYASLMGYEVEMIYRLAGDGAGSKSISFILSGQHCYGNLKTERGVHRLVRLSPFDANNRRHTSFASVEVSPIVDSDVDIEINPADLKVDTYRSSGAGGQHVNKTESAVRITHIPTGIVVACQNERSQVQNKEQAMKMLKAKLIEKQEQEKEKERQKTLSSQKKIEWGSQIRSYVLHPYNMVKDHRTNLSTSDTDGVLDGEIQPFIIEFLKMF